MTRLLALFIIITVISCFKEKEQIDTVPLLNYKLGHNDYSIEIDDALRNFIIHVPASYDRTTPSPVVFMLHGASGTGQKFYNISGWVGKSEEEGIIAIFPTAKAFEIVGKNQLTTRWSTSGLEDIIAPGSIIKDDVIFIKEILQMTKESFNIDDDKVYAVGFSNGGGFIRNRIYKEAPELFTAFATVGSYFISTVQEISSGIYRSLYSIIGSKDPNIIEDSGSNELIPLNAPDFLNHSFYGPMAQDLLDQMMLGTAFEEDPNPLKYNLIRFSDSKTMSNNQLNFMIVNDMTHVYPNGFNNKSGVIATNLIWEWFGQL
jgi:polyhydroxybutyrate depolymerase